MTTWRFSDGTVAHLGGEIEGDTLFAQELRAELAHGDTLIELGATPSEAVKLDTRSTAHMDRFLRREMSAPYRSEQRLRLLDAPSGFEPLTSEDDEPGADDEVN